MCQPASLPRLSDTFESYFKHMPVNMPASMPTRKRQRSFIYSVPDVHISFYFIIPLVKPFLVVEAQPYVPAVSTSNFLPSLSLVIFALSHARHFIIHGKRHLAQLHDQQLTAMSSWYLLLLLHLLVLFRSVALVRMQSRLYPPYLILQALEIRSIIFFTYVCSG